MPKPITEVLAAAEPLKERILAFLRGAPPGQAYALHEIYCEVENLDPELRRLVETMWLAGVLEGKSPTTDRWTQALEQLVSSGDVLKSPMRGIDYYWMSPRGER